MCDFNVCIFTYVSQKRNFNLTCFLKYDLQEYFVEVTGFVRAFFSLQLWKL